MGRAQKDDFVALPVKELQYNRAPAVAPLGVLSQSDGWSRIGMSEEIVTKHRAILLSQPSFAENIRSLIEGRPEYAKSADAEAQLYDSFLPEQDTLHVAKIRQANATQLADLHPEFRDERLAPLLLHYKARNFPSALAEDEIPAWEEWRATRLRRQLPEFARRLNSLSQKVTDQEKQFILQELQLWAESILPIDDAA